MKPNAHAPSFPTLALVLAGGFGTRLQPVTKGRPKSLVEAAGRPFLDYILTYLSDQGIQQVTLCVGHLAGQIKDFAGDGQRWELEVRYSQEEIPLGTGGALRQASLELEQPFFALNGDTVFMVNLRSLWEAHIASQALATLALLRVDDGRARGCVKLDERGRIVAFDEKPAQADSVLVSGGVYVLDPQALAEVEPGRAVSIEREVFPQLAAGRRLAGHVQAAYFADIGTPESLAKFESDVVAGRLLFNFGFRA